MLVFVVMRSPYAFRLRSQALFLNIFYASCIRVESGKEPAKKNKGGRPPIYTKEIADKVLACVAKGLTYERAAEAVGISGETIDTWKRRKPEFDAALKRARRELEVNCLASIHQAGEKSWQARAWLCERVFGYAQPSSRLEVAGAVAHAHAASPALAQLLAGMNSTKSVDGIVNAPLQLADAQGEKSSESIGHKKARRVPRYSKRPTPPRPTAIPPPPSTTHNTPQKIATKNKKGSDASTTATNENPQESPQQAA